ncbi:MAG: DNA repair protein RecN [Hydrotalea sp.]|nr:DNA repair protein RecN [Hydrotalea sp.]
MLRTLTIQNLVIIDQVDIDFQSGLNVLTGETGAGKSILLQAIMMVLGEKIESRIIQAGKDSCNVTAEFSFNIISPNLKNLAETHEFPLDEKSKNLTIRRTLKKDGKSKCWINDTLVGITVLQQLAAELVEIEAQGQSHRLTRVESHRDLLDDYGKHKKILDALAGDYKHWQDLLGEKTTLENEIKKSIADREYLRNAKKELEALNINPDEVKELEEKRRALQSAEKTIAALQEIIGYFNDRNGIMAEGLKVSKLLSRMAGDKKNLSAAADAMDSGLTHLQTAQDLLEKELNDVASPDWSLPEIEDRLFALKDIGRKYRRPVEDLGNYLEEINSQLEGSNQQAKKLENIMADIKIAEKKYYATAETLTASRKKSAIDLTDHVMAVLPDLKLPHASFHIDFLPLDNPSNKGVEKIQFLCQTNPGQNKDLLHKIASGGELARFLLAIEQAIGAGVDCLVFDEVDSGVGGATADAVGKLLLKLSTQQQCFVITHSPQVAAIGKHHFRVEKIINKGKTTSSVKKLNPEERVMEIARMLSAESITKEAEAQAKQLLGR